MNRRSQRLRLPLALVLALLFALLAGCVGLPTGAPRAVPPAERPAHNLRVFDQAWERVRRGYYDGGFHGLDWQEAHRRHRAAAAAAPDDDRLYAAVNAMLDELEDGHTHAITPADFAAERQHHRVLIGLLMRPDPLATDRMLIVAVTPGSSADENHVVPGWTLVTVNGRPPREVLGPGRLREGQVVTCEFRDQAGATHTVALTARVLSTEPVRLARMLEGGVVYLRFDSFDTPSAAWLRSQLHQHETAPGFILDLRLNPGGDAFALARTLGEFFPRPVAAGNFPGRNGHGFRLSTWRWFGSATITAPLAVLVSENSTSSSEIFARVVQFHRRGVIVGTKTAGIVLGSRFANLPGGGRLQLSIRDYVGPDGRHLEGVGVTPDVEVRQTLEDLRAGRDPVVDAALDALRNPGASAAARAAAADDIAANIRELVASRLP